MKRGRPRKIVEDIASNSALEIQERTTAVAEQSGEKPEPKGIVKQIVNDKEYTIEVIKDYDNIVDVFYISDKDPDYEYRFLRDDKKNLTLKTGNLLFHHGGWQLCPREHCKRIGIKEPMLAADGLYRVGENILAFMPKSLFKEKQAQKNKKAREPVDQIRRFVKDGDESVGSSIHASMKGLQSGKKLGMTSVDNVI